MTTDLVQILTIDGYAIKITYLKPVVVKHRVGDRNWEEEIISYPLAPDGWRDDLDKRLNRLMTDEPVGGLIKYLPPPTIVRSLNGSLPYKIEIPTNVGINGIVKIVETWYNRYSSSANR